MRLKGRYKVGILVLLMLITLNNANIIIRQRIEVESLGGWVEVVKGLIEQTSPITSTDSITPLNIEIDINTTKALEYSANMYTSALDSMTSTALQDLNNHTTLGDREIALEIKRQLEYKERERAEARRKSIAAERARRGSLGRLISPSVGIDVALFDSWAQSVCDAPDSACYYYMHGQLVIADHNYQGFKTLPRIKIGDKVYIDNGYSVETYRVVDKFKGRNGDTDMLYRDNPSSALNKYPNSIFMYTCDGPGGINILIVYAVKE